MGRILFWLTLDQWKRCFRSGSNRTLSFSWKRL